MFHVAYCVLVHQAKVGKDIPDCNGSRQRVPPSRGGTPLRQQSLTPVNDPHVVGCL
jgi:hypothetical protein